jgi:hypothetical protein
MATRTSASCRQSPGSTGKGLPGSCMLSCTVVLLASEGVDRGSGRCSNTGRGRFSSKPWVRQDTAESVVAATVRGSSGPGHVLRRRHEMGRPRRQACGPTPFYAGGRGRRTAVGTATGGVTSHQSPRLDSANTCLAPSNGTSAGSSGRRGRAPSRRRPDRRASAPLRSASGRHRRRCAMASPPLNPRHIFRSGDIDARSSRLWTKSARPTPRGLVEQRARSARDA